MHDNRHQGNHFEEQFEDSQMNMSAYGQSQRESHGNLNDQGEAIQLIRIKPSGKIQIDERALDIIAGCDLPVGFVSLVGKYRTGKSFLLNHLLYLEGRGFRVDPSTVACTEGIWMWSKPVYNEQNNNFLFFLDTQGTDSMTKGPDNDAKIFALACLISSYFIFNSVGAIDQRSIGELNMVTTLSSHIIADQKLSSRDNQQHLNRYMPKFMWLLRDFTLELRDERGRRQTSSEYLESVLTDQNPLIRVNEDVKRVRRSLLTYFKDRECLTLVRPARQQHDLQRLNTLPSQSLRKQFIDGVSLLREKIMRKAGPKMYDGDPLYGGSTVSMIEHYVKTMNQGGIPNIKTAWEHISQEEGAFAYNRAIEKYNSLYETYFPDDRPKDQIDQLPQILGTLRHQAMTTFTANSGQPPSQAYEMKLKDFLHDKQKQITKINKQLNQCRNVEILRDCVMDLARNIENNGYEGRRQDLERDLQKAKDDYNRKAKGAHKGDVLSEFLTTLYPSLVKNAPQKDDMEAQHLLAQKQEQYQHKIKQLEKQLKSAQNEANVYKTTKPEIPVASNPNNPKIKPNKKNQKKGCCGTTSCEIM